MRRAALLYLGLFALIGQTGLAFAADAEAGKAVFEAQCSACHSLDPDEARNGPTLKGIAGRKSASVATFDYSDAMSSAGLVWDAATLDTYLQDPRAKVPGTKMAFPGLPDGKQRQDLIAYLNTLR